jgi:hypothetical protein
MMMMRKKERKIWKIINTTILPRVPQMTIPKVRIPNKTVTSATKTKPNFGPVKRAQEQQQDQL